MLLFLRLYSYSVLFVSVQLESDKKITETKKCVCVYVYVCVRALVKADFEDVHNTLDLRTVVLVEARISSVRSEDVLGRKDRVRPCRIVQQRMFNWPNDFGAKMKFPRKYGLKRVRLYTKKNSGLVYPGQGLDSV